MSRIADAQAVSFTTDFSKVVCFYIHAVEKFVLRHKLHGL